MNDITLFSVLGWEERFLEGINQIIDNNKVKCMYLIYFSDYMHMNRMDENLRTIERISKDNSILLEKVELKYEDSVGNWHLLNKLFVDKKFQDVILNITTFPRETIWTLLFFLQGRVSSAKYIYNKPNSYDKSEGGLTKNHKNPRLLFKHSGIFDIDKELVLFVITGFDNSRTDLLIEHYEPAKVVYLSQKGEQFDNISRNCGISPKNDCRNIICDCVEINCYEINETCNILNKLIKEYSEYNIIISSHGPKTSAISTYQAYLENKDIALAYVPAREFSGDYSKGFNPDSIIGDIKLSNSHDSDK